MGARLGRGAGRPPNPSHRRSPRPKVLTRAPPAQTPSRPPAAAADADTKVFESHGKQIVVESNGTIIIGPGAGAANGAGLPAPRETAETEYLTGEPGVGPGGRWWCRAAMPCA